MAYVVIVINSPNHGIGTLNDKCQRAGNAHTALNLCADYLQAIVGGAVDASVVVTTRDSAPTVTTSGSGSAQNTYDLT